MNNIKELKNLSENKKKLFTDLIYQNFIKIAQYEQLKHNKQEIYNLLSKSSHFFIVYIVQNKILGYILGEIINFEKKKILFITYIFTSPKHRNIGLGHKLMNYVDQYALSNNCIKIMLTCDTEDKKIYCWYF